MEKSKRFSDSYHRRILLQVRTTMVWKTAACIAISESTAKEFKRCTIHQDWNVFTHLYGADHLVFRPKNHDEEEEQLAHEAVRKRYDAADELALSGDVNTETLLFAVGRLEQEKVANAA